MKNFLILIASTLFFFPSMGQELTFDVTTIDAGDVAEGDTFYYDFHFKNTGKAPLVISQCKTSCGCTAATCPTDAIPPGESSVIQIGYGTKGRPGTISKSVTIYSNAVNSMNGINVINIRGNVKK